MKITKSQLLQIIKEETQGEMQFAPLETARQAYLQEPNDDTKHELGLMVQKLVEPLMNEMGLFWEAEAYYNVGNLVFNNRKVEVTIDPKGAMGRYDVNVSAQVSAMDTDPAFKPMDITLPSMKGVVQFINDKVFSSSGMAGEPEAQTELPFGKGGLAKEHKVRITKTRLQKIIKEAIQAELGESSTEDKIKREFPAATISVTNDGEIIVVVNDEDDLVALQQDPDTQRYMTDEFGDWAATDDGFVISPA